MIIYNISPFLSVFFLIQPTKTAFLLTGNHFTEKILFFIFIFHNYLQEFVLNFSQIYLLV